MNLWPGAGRPGHDDEGAMEPHHPIHRFVEVVVIKIGAGLGHLETNGHGCARGDRSAVENAGDEEGMGLIQVVGHDDPTKSPSVVKIWARGIRPESYPP